MSPRRRGRRRLAARGSPSAAPWAHSASSACASSGRHGRLRRVVLAAQVLVGQGVDVRLDVLRPHPLGGVETRRAGDDQAADLPVPVAAQAVHDHQVDRQRVVRRPRLDLVDAEQAVLERAVAFGDPGVDAAHEGLQGEPLLGRGALVQKARLIAEAEETIHAVDIEGAAVAERPVAEQGRQLAARDVAEDVELRQPVARLQIPFGQQGVVLVARGDLPQPVRPAHDLDRRVEVRQSMSVAVRELRVVGQQGVAHQVHRLAPGTDREQSDQRPRANPGSSPHWLRLAPRGHIAHPPRTSQETPELRVVGLLSCWLLVGWCKGQRPRPFGKAPRGGENRHCGAGLRPA